MRFPRIRIPKFNKVSWKNNSFHIKKVSIPLEIQKKVKHVFHWCLFGIFHLIILGAIIFTMRHLFIMGPVQGASMEPTLSSRYSFYIANRLAYEKTEPVRGDVIICKLEGSLVVKRVIGLPGEKIAFRNGYVWIDDKALYEPYLSADTLSYCNETFTVPKGMFFVMGDNRTQSYDSRFTVHPYIGYDDIKGCVLFATNGLRPVLFYRWMGQELSYEELKTDQAKMTSDGSDSSVS